MRSPSIGCHWPTGGAALKIPSPTGDLCVTRSQGLLARLARFLASLGMTIRRYLLSFRAQSAERGISPWAPAPLSASYAKVSTGRRHWHAGGADQTRPNPCPFQHGKGNYVGHAARLGGGAISSGEVNPGKSGTAIAASVKRPRRSQRRADEFPVLLPAPRSACWVPLPVREGVGVGSISPAAGSGGPPDPIEA